MQKMYMLITITQRSDSEEFTNFFRKHETKITYSTPSRGTAKEIKSLLFGIEQSLKTVHYCLVTENKKNELLKALTKEMAIDLPNRGIAVAIPLSSFAGRKALSMYTDGHENDEVNEVYKMEEKKPMELIIVICEKGRTDEVMDAARAAGAGGGTVVHAKGTGAQYTAKFFGMSIADEKEMIYIVSSAAKKKDIMTSIIENAGPQTKAHAVAFSLSVSDTAGLRIFNEE